MQPIKNIWIISLASVLALCSPGCGPALQVGDCVEVLGKPFTITKTDGIMAQVAGQACLGVACFEIQFDMPVRDVQDCLDMGACRCED